MQTDPVERATAFDQRLVLGQSTDVVEWAWGFAVLHGDFPHSHFHNRVIVTSPIPVIAVVRAADEVLGGAGLAHRYITLEGDAVDEALAAGFVAAGYQLDRQVTMLHCAPVPDRSEPEVRVVTLDALRPTLIEDWRRDLPGEPDEVHRQLADRTALVESVADLLLLAVIDGGSIVAHAEVYIDRSARVAQLENVMTHPDCRGRGLATAVVAEALRRSRTAGCDLTALSASVEDWPRSWYSRLGFVEASSSYHLARDG